MPRTRLHIPASTVDRQDWVSQKKQHYHEIFTVRYQLLPLGQQNSRPVSCLLGDEADPIPYRWHFWAKGDRVITS